MSPSSPCRCHSTSVLPSRSIESPRGSACYACPLTFRDGCPQASVRTEPGRLLAFRFMSELLAVVLPRPAAAAEIVRAWEAGRAVLPLDPAAPAPELRAVLDALRPTHLVDRDGVEALPGGEPVEDGVAAVVATSGTTGRPEGVELAIAGGGEITLRGPMLLRRYRRDPAATRKALRGGWLHTADLGRVRPDGRLEVLGRRDDLVITGGVSVHPAEVEAVLVRHPGVADVAVGSAPDPEWGQRLVAYVVPLDRLLPPTLADLRGFARERLAAAKAPRELVLVDGLPRTASGKLLRRRLPSVTPAGTWPAEASGDAVAEGR